MQDGYLTLDDAVVNSYRALLRAGFVVAQIETHNSAVRQRAAQAGVEPARAEPMPDQSTQPKKHRFPVLTGGSS